MQKQTSPASWTILMSYLRFNPIIWETEIWWQIKKKSRKKGKECSENMTNYALDKGYMNSGSASINYFDQNTAISYRRKIYSKFYRGKPLHWNCSQETIKIIPLVPKNTWINLHWSICNSHYQLHSQTIWAAMLMAHRVILLMECILLISRISSMYRWLN